MDVRCGSAPLQEFGGVVESEGSVVILNVVCGQQFVNLFQLDNAGLVELRGVMAPIHLSGVVDIQCRPFEFLGEWVWSLLEFFWRF